MTPSAKSPRQDRSRETREILLEATRQLLVKEGYAGATTRKIAKRAGMSVGTVYHHFQNRNAAVAELLMQSFQGDIALIKPLIDTAVNGGMSLRDLALTFVETIVENAVQHHHLYAAVFRDSDLPVSLVNRMKNDLALVARDVATVLQRHPECPVPDAAMAATFLVRLVDHLTDLYLLTDELHSRRQEDFVTELAWLITAYLTTPREGGSPGSSRPPSMPAAV